MLLVRSSISVLFCLCILLVGCAPDPSAIETAIAQTEAARPTSTATATPTSSSTPTSTVTATPRSFDDSIEFLRSSVQEKLTIAISQSQAIKSVNKVGFTEQGLEVEVIVKSEDIDYLATTAYELSKDVSKGLIDAGVDRTLMGLLGYGESALAVTVYSASGSNKFVSYSDWETMLLLSNSNLSFEDWKASAGP